MIDKIRAAIVVLRHGEELTHAETWKSRQNSVNVLVALLGAAAVFAPIEISADDISAVAGGIAAVVGLFNAYTTTATSKRIGVQAGSGDSNDPPGQHPTPVT